MKPLDRVQAIAMIVSPLLLVGATATFAADGSFYDSELAGGLQFAAMAVMAVAVAGVTRLLAPASPALAATGAVVGHLGVAAGAGFGIERIYTANGAEALNDLGAAVPLYPFGLMFPLGMVVLGYGLAKAGGPWPRWTGFALMAGGVLFPISRIGGLPILGLVADITLAVGLVTLGAWALGLVSSERRAVAFA